MVFSFSMLWILYKPSIIEINSSEKKGGEDVHSSHAIGAREMYTIVIVVG